MKKRVISLCMALLMVVSLLPSTAFAADSVSISVGSVSAEPGKDVTVDVNIAGASAAAFMAVYLDFSYDSNLTLSAVSLSDAAITAGFTNGVHNLSKGIVQIEGDPSTGSSIADGLFFTLTFTVGESATGTYPISVDYSDSDSGNVYDINSNDVPCSFTPGAITVKTAVADGYTATMTTSAANNEVVSEGSINVNVAVSHSSDIYFNAGEITLTYDETLLNPDTDALDEMVAAGTLSGYNVASGELRIADFGADKNLPYTYSIPFKAASVVTETTTPVVLGGAAFILKENAHEDDLLVATKTPDLLTVTIKVAMVDVTLTNSDNAGDTSTVQTQKGQDYTFAPDDTANYTYSNVTATVDDNEVNVTDNGNGTFTIAAENVTGDIELTYTKTAKSYEVTFAGDASDDVTDGADKATYNADYTFTMPSAAGFAYSLDSITINGSAYTGYTVEGSVYTIPGAAITGPIVITISKSATEAGVTVQGDGAGAAAGYDTTADLNEDYTLTITPEVGYTYSVTATMGGTTANVIDNQNNTYTIKNVTGAIVFTVTKTLNVETVKVTEYVKVDSYVVYLVTYDGTLATGKAPTYDNNVMFWSDSYNAYCWLVIDSTLTADAAKSKISAATGKATDVDYGMDINDTNITDAADAQMVWNMYNALYSDFDTVTMAQFLAADQNATSDANWGLNVQDAQVIIAAILANATT